jgi:hypothetical protein
MTQEILAKLASKKGRKLAAQDVKIMMTTQALKRWVNAQRDVSLATELFNAEQVKRSTLGQRQEAQGRISG